MQLHYNVKPLGPLRATLMTKPGNCKAFLAKANFIKVNEKQRLVAARVITKTQEVDREKA